MAGCESLNQPLVNLCPNISLSPIPGIPPLGPGLPPARNEEDRELHRQIAQGSQQLFDSGLAIPQRRPRCTRTWRRSPTSSINSIPPDSNSSPPAPPSTSPPKSSRKKSATSGRRSPIPIGLGPGNPPGQNPTPRRLVAVSFSTTFQGHTSVLQNIIDALAPLTGPSPHHPGRFD